MSDNNEAKPRELMTLGTKFASLVIGLVGIVLFWLTSHDEWWSGAKYVQATLNALGAVLVASVPITLFWELSGKRRFLDEILIKAQIAKEIENAGIVNAYDSFQRIIDWAELFQDAAELDLFIAYGHSWRSNNREHLKQLLEKRHARLRVVLPDPEDDATVNELARQFNYRPENVRDKIIEAFNDFKSIAPDGKKVEIYYFQSMAPNFTFYRFASKTVLALYNHNLERAPVPAFVVRDGGFLYGYLRDQFSVIRKNSRQVFPKSST